MTNSTEFKITSTVEKTVDLASLPFKEWPTEAQKLAVGILSNPFYKQQFDSELFKLEWLASRVCRAKMTIDDL